MNQKKIKKLEDGIKKKNDQLKTIKDTKKRTILNLQIQIAQLNIRIEKLKY
jgi:hypothetical protein